MAKTALSTIAVPGKPQAFSPKDAPSVSPRPDGLYTELSVMATPGRRHAFLPKGEAPVIPDIEGMADPSIPSKKEPFDIGYYRWRYGAARKKKESLEQEIVQIAQKAEDTRHITAGEVDITTISRLIGKVEVSIKPTIGNDLYRLRELIIKLQTAQLAEIEAEELLGRIQNNKAAIMAVMQLIF